MGAQGTSGDRWLLGGAGEGWVQGPGRGGQTLLQVRGSSERRGLGGRALPEDNATREEAWPPALTGLT